MKKLIVILLCLNFNAYANKRLAYKPQDFVLPQDVEKMSQQSGRIYYSPTSKTKALIPIHMWGEINQGGLHYLPTDTTLIRGLSLAGGPSGTAELAEVKVTRQQKDGSFETYEFDLKDGEGIDSHKFILKPGDSVFVPQDRFDTNRAYYTSLIGVVATILSSILIYEQVAD